MAVARFILAFFYLQPSLIITFVPIQIILLALFLYHYKKISLAKSFFLSGASVLLAVLIIGVLGFFIVHFFHKNFWEFIFLSWIESLLLVVASSSMYAFLINYFLQYLFKIRNVTGISWLSSAIAGLSVLGLYHLLWH